ncbi:MAG: M50 family metallopeptidase [Fimbriimonas sp.]
MNLSKLNAIFNWSVRVGSLFGIPIFLNITIIFFLLPALRGSGWDFWHALEYAALIVLSILIHELGHALTAKRYRLKGLSIMLHGMGGFASSTGARTPRQDLLIVLAGPAATFAIGLICLAVARTASADPYTEAFNQLFIIEQLGRTNILLGFLNLIPSLPWDGGRALSAILAHRMHEVKALRLVAHLGLIITPPLLLYGIFGGQGFFTLFAIVGLFTSYMTLKDTGGIRFGEALQDRKDRKELEALKKREAAKQEAYLGDVYERQREREEQERLRKMFK